MSADFKPTLDGYKDLKPFVFWAQTTMPTVFDDSLSYYEVLTKLTKMVNVLLENTDTAEHNIEAVVEVFEQLQDYVNHYFDDLDVTEEVNAKLDQMAEDGTLSEIIMPLIARYLDETVPEIVDARLSVVVHDQLPDVVSQQIDDAVDPLVQPAVDVYLDEELSGIVADQLPAAVTAQLPAEVATQFPDVAAEQLPDLVDDYMSDNLPTVVADQLPAEVNDQLEAVVHEELPEVIVPYVYSEVSSTTANWLATHIQNPSNPPLDSSLSVKNAAAESWYVGKRIYDLQSSPPTITEDVKIDPVTGAAAAMAGWLTFKSVISSKFPCSIGYFAGTADPDYPWSYAFYDSDDTCISGGTWTQFINWGEVTVPVPTDTAYIQFSMQYTTATFDSDNLYVLVWANGKQIIDALNEITVEVTVDPTLSEAGEAADAKATGDAIAAENARAIQNLADVTGKRVIQFTPGGYWTTPDTGGTPAYVENANWATARFNVTSGDWVFISGKGTAGTTRLFARIGTDGKVTSRSAANLSDLQRVEVISENIVEFVVNTQISTHPNDNYIYISKNRFEIETFLNEAFYTRVGATDLDEAVTAGCYNWATSSHPLNAPTETDGVAFNLLVFTSNVTTVNRIRTLQVIVTQPTNPARSVVLYRYRLSTGTWTAWQQLMGENSAQKYWCYGKKINWTGDSIVAGGDFDDLVSEELGMIETDYGISGSTIALKADGTDGRNAIVARYENMSNDADVIAVSAGTNDWMYAWCPVGNINSTENTTFYGALKNLCYGLITKYPRAVIFFTTPLKRSQPFTNGDGGAYTPDNVPTDPFSKNKYGYTLMDYCDIIKEVCAYYSIPVLDLNRESLMNPQIPAQADLFSDGTHPSEAGRRIQARRVAGWLTQLAHDITG